MSDWKKEGKVKEMAPIMMAGESEDDARRFEAYQDLLRLAGSYEDTAGTVPQLAVIGIESHGKSSLVQAYVGFPCVFIGQGTATRCPVEYTLTHDPDCEDPAVEFAPPGYMEETIPANQLEAALGRHMKSLGDGFSSQSVRVKVRSKDCVNIVLLDLPGIIINPAEGKDADKAKVDEIVQFYASQPSNFLILVEKAMSSANSEALPKEMRRLVGQTRPNWHRECIIIATMFDQQVRSGNLGTLEDAFTFYKSSQHPSQPRKHYVSLLPRPASDKDPIGHIRRQRALEQEMIENWVQTITASARPGEVLPPEFRAQIGLEHARAAIQDKFYELISTTGAFSRLRQKLREHKAHYEAEVKRRQLLLDGVMRPGNLRASVDSLSRSFLSGVNSLFQYTNAVRKPFESQCLDFFSEVDLRGRERPPQEDAPAPVPFEPEWRARLQQLCREDEVIRYEVVAPLLGSTQINRATLVFKYLVLASGHEDWSDPGLQKRVFGHLAGSPSTKVNYDKGIRELVKGGLTDNLTESPVLRWYLDHLEWILRHNGRLVMAHVLDSGEFGHLKDSQVPATLMESYRVGVKELLHEIGQLFNQTAWVHSQYVAHMQVAELVEILDAIPRAERDYLDTNPFEPSAPPPSSPPSGSTAIPRVTQVPSSNGPDSDDAAEADEDEFVEAPPPGANPSAVGGPGTYRTGGQGNGPAGVPAQQPRDGYPRPGPPKGSSGVGTTALAANGVPAAGHVAGPQPSRGGLVGYGKDGAAARGGVADEEGYFVANRNAPPPRTGLPAHMISAVCNRKSEGTPAVATPGKVCAWVRETYFFNVILLLRQMEFFVNSMVVLELNGDVSRKKSLDCAIGAVMRLDEEELDKLRDFNLVEIAEKQKEEAALLEKLTADHKLATEAIAVLEQPRQPNPVAVLA